MHGYTIRGCSPARVDWATRPDEGIRGHVTPLRRPSWCTSAAQPDPPGEGSACPPTRACPSQPARASCVYLRCGTTLLSARPMQAKHRDSSDRQRWSAFRPTISCEHLTDSTSAKQQRRRECHSLTLPPCNAFGGLFVASRYCLSSSSKRPFAMRFAHRPTTAPKYVALVCRLHHSTGQQQREGATIQRTHCWTWPRCAIQATSPCHDGVLEIACTACDVFGTSAG